MNVDEDRIRAQFEALEDKLPELWRQISGGTSWEHTSVVVPSISFDQTELTKIQGVPFYEERLLFTLIRLTNPAARLVYVTSHPIHPEIVDYYLQLLYGVPSGHARRRLQMFSVFDGSPEALTDKILARPRLVQRIRHAIGDTSRAYLTCFNSTDRERRLAVELGIPLNGVHPDRLSYGTKSGARGVFKESAVPAPRGIENIHSEDELLQGLEDLWSEPSPPRAAVVKLNEGFAGQGNALFQFPSTRESDESGRRSQLRQALTEMKWSAEDENLKKFLSQLSRMGGVVEEFVSGHSTKSPSVQMRITPTGEPTLVSTHEQVLGGPTGQVYVGCRFPADQSYRTTLQDYGWRVAKCLSQYGVISRFGLDFMVISDESGNFDIHAIEINLRMGGTTHPYMALQFLTGGELDAESGLHLSARGEPKFYFSTDNLKSPHYRGLLPDDLMDILIANRLQFRPSTETGVVFHMIGGLSQYGKLGVTCIGNSPEEADALYDRCVAVLDRETGARKDSGGEAFGWVDAPFGGME